MKFIEIKERELREITLFLIDRKIIFHPSISPDGTPDFTGIGKKKYCLILDRNLLVKILRLVNNGELKDEFSLKVVSSLLLWAEFNNIAITAGLALVEYSHFHKSDLEASIENSTFLEIYKQYDPSQWLDLATGRIKSIQPIKLDRSADYNFFVENDHLKMHYLEMLKVSQLFFNSQVPVRNKFELFHQWVYDKILICKYTTYLVALVFGNRSKLFKNLNRDFKEVSKMCKNQAWDLSYLSLWSTQYYYEQGSEDIFLFATDDKELKELFTLTHKEPFNIYKDLFGEKVGGQIKDRIDEIYIHRERPNISKSYLDNMIDEEEQNLKQILTNYTAY